MSVIYQASQPHSCAPGWTYRDQTPVEKLATSFGPHIPEGHKIAVPPMPHVYPPGTVWQCECGKTWVSLGAIYDNEPGGCHWRPEKRRERRRRERRG